MDGTQQLVGAGGAVLVLANFWKPATRQTLNAGLFNSSATSAQTEKAHGELIKLGSAGAFVVAAVLIAGANKSAGTAMAVMIVTLFVLWALNHYSPATSAATARKGK